MKLKKRARNMDGMIKDFGRELAEATDEAQFNDALNEFIKFQRSFYRYSFNNQVLIHGQKPDAQLVAGFHQWKEKYGRHVKKGKSAIWIFAPQRSSDKEQVIVTYPDGSTETTKIAVHSHLFFKPVPVFDVSQTEGEPLPDADTDMETADFSEYLRAMEQAVKEQGITLVYKDMSALREGYTDGETIAINDGMSDDDKLLSLVHEYLHLSRHFEDDRDEYGKQEKEIEAEATAYIVGCMIGMRPKGYNYLALHEADGEAILQRLERISKAIKDIMEMLENHVSEQVTRPRATV